MFIPVGKTFKTFEPFPTPKVNDNKVKFQYVLLNLKFGRRVL